MMKLWPDGRKAIAGVRRFYGDHKGDAGFDAYSIVGIDQFRQMMARISIRGKEPRPGKLRPTFQGLKAGDR